MIRRLLISALWSCTLALVVCFSVQAQDDAAVALEPIESVGETHYWIEAVAPYAGARFQLSLTAAEDAGTPGLVRLTCAATSTDTLSKCVLRVEILDGGGQSLNRMDRVLSVDEFPREHVFEWDGAAVPFGEYALELTLFREPGIVMVARDYRLMKHSWDGLCANLDALQQEVAVVADSLEREGGSGAVSAHVTARLAIAQDVLVRARQAVADHDWVLLERLNRYLRDSCASLRARVTFAGAAPELAESAVVHDLSRLEVRDGVFSCDGRPVFLFGRHFDEGRPVREIERLRDYGLNLAAIHCGPEATLAGPDAVRSFEGDLDSVFGAAKARNVSVMLSVAPERLPKWALDQWPQFVDADLGGVNVVLPAVRGLTQRHIDALGPYLARQDMLSVVNLLNAPRFKFEGPKVREDFLALAKERYGDRHGVNRAWHALLADMEDIAIGWDLREPRYQDRAAYRYDWQAFHMALGGDYVRALAAEVRRANCGKPITVAFEDGAFEQGESRWGVDREAILEQLAVTACCATSRHEDPHYAMAYPGSLVTYVLLKSMAPEKPVVNFVDDMLMTPASDAPRAFRFVHTSLWEAAMAGLSASALRVDDFRVEPQCLDAFSTAAIGINRLGDIVAAFQRAPAEVAILWSMPSKIYDGGVPYLSAATYAYEGCSFAGHKLRFITEDQCARGDLDGVKVLIIPEALAVGDEAFGALGQYLKSGRIIVRTATSPILFDARGNSRDEIVAVSPRTVLVSGENLPTEYLHAMDSVMTAFGELPTIPRTISHTGYPLEGVKSRYLELDGQGYLYVVNLRQEPVHCDIVGPAKSGRDLIQGRDVRFPAPIEPLDPMLIHLDPPEQPEPDGAGNT